MEYRTIADLSNLIRTNIYKIPHDVDVVVGVPRSGMLPATMIALYLNKKLSDIDTFFSGGGKTYSCGERKRLLCKKNDSVRKVLVVDDSVNLGHANQNARNIIMHSDLKYDCIFLAPYATKEGRRFVDIYFEEIEYPRIFEWNLFHHPLLSNSFMDIDGVLNVDLPVDDDGPIYSKYLKEAIPLFTPTVSVGTLISCRLEKYRDLTEEWLNKNNIKYDKLILLDFPDKETRQEWNKHGEYKAEWYKKNKGYVFVESDRHQAQVIANITKRPVICVETNSLVLPNTIEGRLEVSLRSKIKRKFPTLTKILVRVKRLFLNK